MKKLSLLAGGAVGFLLGSRAGRRPYEQFEQAVRQMANRPEAKQIIDQAQKSASSISDAAGRSTGQTTTGSAQTAPPVTG